MKRHNLFIDLDGVLIDTQKFGDDFKALLKNLGASQKSLLAYYSSPVPEYRKYRSRTYYLIKHIENVGHLFGFKDVNHARQEINALIDKLDEYLFSDAIYFLESIQEHNVFLVTYGGFFFQQLKIDQINIKQYFCDIAITSGGLKTEAIVDFQQRRLIESFDGIFIDDRLKEIIPMKQTFPNITTILLQRDKGIMTSGPDICLPNLNDVLDFIDSKTAQTAEGKC